MRFATRIAVATAAICGAFGQSAVPAARAQEAEPASTISLDSLLNTRISAASKYEQTSAEAPASVTILSSDDLRAFGYRTLQEVLESVRGFYVSNDRNYPFLGARGFSRPTDYNNRILLLIDGHTLNDQTWGGAPMGSDLPINLDAVERIEIVRGPGSVLYGTNAMFAVINIVTKTPARLDGVIVGTRVGSAGLREGTLAAGRSLGSTSSFTLSGIVSRLDGTDLYFPDFDAPETNSGIAQNLDWERAAGALGALTIGNLVVHSGYRVRTKGIPTAAFDVAFNDPRAETFDDTFWGDVAVARDVGAQVRLRGRLYADRYRYSGVYPADSGPAYSDGGGSTAVGGEGILAWEASSRNRLTVGVEHRRVVRAEYYERAADGTVTRDDQPTSLASLFAQHEFQLSHTLSVVGGLRWDGTSRNESAVSPRLAIIATPARTMTFKALYGEGFRAPSPAEAEITTTYYAANPQLRAERIRTLELVAELRIGAPFLLSGSLYGYRIHDLIDQEETPAGGLEFRNVATSDGTGAEVALEYRPAGRFSAHASYVLQQTSAAPTGDRLTNSPAQIGFASVTVRGERGFMVSAQSRYESGRRTLAGPSTRAFIRTDASASWSPTDLSGAEVRLRVTNLFDASYQTPGGVEHLQNAFTQDQRRLALQLSWRF